MDNFQSSKENVRPLRGGRKFDCLVNSFTSKGEMDQRKKEFEQQLQQLSGAELLNAYYEYIIWIEQSYDCTEETMLKNVLEQCLEHFFKIPEKQLFANDKKLLSIFLKHTSMCNNPLDFFRSAYISGFFKTLAPFYIEWSFHYEVFNDMDHALKMLQGGISKKAQPAESILSAIEKLKQRKAEYRDNPETVPTGEHRQAFNQLKVRVGNLAPVDRINNVVIQPIQNRGLRPQSSGQQPPPKSASTVQKVVEDNFFILPENAQSNGNDEAVEGPVNLPFEKQAIPQSIKGNENMIKPGKWNETALKQQSKTGPSKEGFKVLNEASAKTKSASKSANEKPSKPVDYSMFSWYKIASQVYGTDGEMSFEEIRYKSYMKKRQELEAKAAEIKKDEFVAPKPKLLPEELDGLEELDKFQSPKNNLVTPTELLNVTVDHAHHKTLDFTVSNFRTEDFTPNLGSTPQINRTKLSFVPTNLSPLIEVSYKSSSSSGAYTASTTQHENDKSMPSQEVYEYPFKPKSIRLMLRSLKKSIETFPGFNQEHTSMRFKRGLFVDDDKVKHAHMWIGDNELKCSVAHPRIVDFNGVDLFDACVLNNRDLSKVIVRLLDDGQWDFYIRHQIHQRSQAKQNKPLLGLFMNKVFFYNDRSASLDPLTELHELDQLDLQEFPFFSAFCIYNLIVLIESLHSIKIVAGNVHPKNLLVKKVMSSSFPEGVFEFLNLSSAADLSLVPDNCLSFKKFQFHDWTGLLNTVCFMLTGEDLSDQSIVFKINVLSNITGKGSRKMFISKLGKIVSQMFQEIFLRDTQQADLSVHKQELIDLIKFRRFIEIEFRMKNIQYYSSLVNIFA